ncbi:LRP2-binding protein-like [Liolophura sinensis]|uniref:LRP2-binding protein-like n=1 Tax=Liolophura sinensis TaxID=3198878 RepID=UPI0031584626
MELTKDISSEPLPSHNKTTILEEIALEAKYASPNVELNESELFDAVESILLGKIKNGEKQAYFQLGQFYYEQELFKKALIYFERSRNFDFQSMYQVAVMLFDGTGCDSKPAAAVDLMMKVATSDSKQCRHLVHVAQYNLGRAYYQGVGVQRQSNTEAERWWLLAADDGNPRASIKAQTALGLFYSTEDNFDLKKAFFWHSEATGNGSLESQGALGVMYEYGVGVKADTDAAYICLTEAADRGNVYAMGNLIAHYYKRKLFTKAADLASRVAELTDITTLASETDCIPNYISKGISLASFYYARCLAVGHGVTRDQDKAKLFYSKSYQFDADVCAHLQNITQHGII